MILLPRQTQYIQQGNLSKPPLFPEYSLRECQLKSNQDNDPGRHVV